MTSATCRTEGCPNSGIPIQVATTWEDEDTGEATTADAVICGACGQPITDLEDT